MLFAAGPKASRSFLVSKRFRSCCQSLTGATFLSERKHSPSTPRVSNEYRDFCLEPHSCSRTLTPMSSSRAKSTISKFIPKKSEAVDTFLQVAINGIEISKEAITAAAPVPGLSIVLDIVTKLLKKIQVRQVAVFLCSWLTGNQDTRSNSKMVVSLCNEIKTLLDTLENLARSVQTRLQEYSYGSPERLEAETRFYQSSSLIDRVEKLSKCVDTPR